MHPFKVWVMAMRPKTLPISIGPTLLGTILAWQRGFFDPFLFIMTLCTALGIQICANFANDYFDCLKGGDSLMRKGPTRVTQAGLISLSTMKRGLFVSFGLTALLGCYLIWHGGFAIACLVALSLLCAALYTAGPFPLAYVGLGDLFVFAFFGPIAVCGAYFLQTRHFSWEAFLAGIGAGALSVTPLIVNNIRDREEDITTGKKTLVVRFGKRFGQIEYIACLLVGAAVPFFFCPDHPFCLLSLFFLIPCIPMARTIFSYQDPRALNLVLAQNGKVLLLYYLLFCLGWQWG